MDSDNNPSWQLMNREPACRLTTSLLAVIVEIGQQWRDALFMVSGTTTAGNEKAKQTGIIKRIIKRIDDWLTEEARKISDETPLSDPTKAFGELKEDKYKAELQLVDRYQSFVAELLRL